jgi:hypothetical protein
LAAALTEVVPTPAATAATHGPAKLPCANCGFPNEVGDRFCGNCRSPLGQPDAPAAAAAGPAPATPVASAPMAAAAAQTPGMAPATKPAQPVNPAPVQPTAPLKPGEIACPNCGTPNGPARLFCVKCATQLRAEAAPAKKPPFRLHRGMVLPFVLSAVIGLGATIGGARIGAIVLARAPQPTEQPGSPESTPFVIPGPEGDTIGFKLKPDQPKPVAPLPDDKTIRLEPYEVPTPSEANDPNHRAKWWNDTEPRIPQITQFDHGPLQGSNCVMAAGAMLAELAYGVVVTASDLRAHQSDQDGPSSYGDLNQAMKTLFGVGFLRGLLSPTQLRALSYAGAGVVVSLDYGEIPVDVRVQRTFDGNHSVYIDAFTVHGPDGRPAYWVMDPIGHFGGYKGGWWPAEDVERAGLVRSGGKIYATWAFAGGIVPERHKVLPFEAYPGASAAPTSGPTEPPPSADPMPSGDLPSPPDDPDNGTPPPEIPEWIPIDIQTNLYLIEPQPEGLACTVQPIPATCPGGIIGVLGAGGANDPTAPPINQIQVLYGTVIAPGTVQIVFDSPPGTDGQLWTFSDNGLPIVRTLAEPATIGSNNVSVANIQVSSSGTLSFFATATSPSYSGFSTVGSLVVRG